MAETRSGYIGRQPGESSVVVATQVFSPTGVQTDFTFAAGYTIGYLDVYLNGVRQVNANDYYATDGSTVTFPTNQPVSGDTVECLAYKAFDVGNVTAASGDFSVGRDLSVTGRVDVTGDTALTGTLSVGGTATFTGSITGDGSGLTGVASTDYIITGTAATFNNVVNFNTSASQFNVAPHFNNGVVLTGVTTGLNVTGITTLATTKLGAGITVAGYGVDTAGVVTATSFVGDVTGDVTGTASNASGLTGSPNISVNVVSAAAGAVVTGVCTATSFSGDGSSLSNLNIPAGFDEFDALMFT